MDSRGLGTSEVTFSGELFPKRSQRTEGKKCNPCRLGLFAGRDKDEIGCEVGCKNQHLCLAKTSSSRCWAGMCSALGGTERRAAGPAVSSPVPEPQLHWSVPEPTGFRMRAGPHGALWPRTRETACVSCHQRAEPLKCAAPVCRGRAPNVPSPSVELREAPLLPSCSRFCSKIRPADWPLCCSRADEPDGGSWRDGRRANFTQNTHNGLFQRVDI
ncbi:hypothetical protein ROHU_007234 [Labeo rohita]|uniref:Uncharacterized protein n=1 Tax=Labeo rohita TaxID=84645 RepID=A0A498ML96_LABRO|nr:hypothetical protein ROHU_007234 [Labeo rohita]